MQQFQYLKNGATLTLNQDACIGCGRCYDVCPHQVLAVANRKAQIVNRQWCMECGACKKNCPVGVIEVHAGVGCAAAILNGYLKRTAPTCGCSGSSCCG